VSFVLYDVETTGLNKRFDQIVQFAAVHTDSDLNVRDRIEICCRLMPHVIPSPQAMQVTGLRIGQLLDPSLPSHYEMVTEVRHKLESWCPSMFLGFNSLSFDEEFLRQAFYLSLYNPYLTNSSGNARADVLNLCRMTAALRPNALKPATDHDGRKKFRLNQLAEANGIAAPTSHRAMADVTTTLALCQLIKDNAPEIWSQFLKFSQKRSVESFVTDEDAFVVSETVGNDHRARVVTLIGKHAEQPTKHYCLDIGTDLDTLQDMSDGDLVNLCRSSARPIVTIRTNAAPTLWELHEVDTAHLAPFEDQAKVLNRVERLREDKNFLERLRHAAQSAEPDFPPSLHLEDQIYGHTFPSRDDERLMHEFRASSWEKRAVLARQFNDSRYCRIALRIIYLERPDLLAPESQAAIENAIQARLMAAPDADVPWRSILKAKRDLGALLQSDLQRKEMAILTRYSDHLEKREEEISRSLVINRSCTSGSLRLTMPSSRLIAGGCRESRTTARMTSVPR